MIGRNIDPDESLFSNRTGHSTKADAGSHVPERNSAEGTGQRQTAGTRFNPRPARCTLDQVVLPAGTHTQLGTLLSRIQNHRLLYDDWELGKIDPQGRHVAFNLFGPPGTGKTMCAEGLAAALGKKILDVNYAEIESKYVGDTGKNIVAAFDAAKQSRSMLFFDEADSILGRRMTNVTQAADHGVNVARAVMLKQLDDFDGIVAFATNLAQNFDRAFVRRILQHIEIGLPDEEGRKTLWSRMVSDKVPGRDLVDWDAVAAASDSLSGGDIRNAVIISLSNVAGRAASDRRLTTEDLREATRQVRKANESVGRPDHSVRVEEWNGD